MAKKGKPTKTARKKENSSKFLAIAITVIIISIAIYYFYSADQAKIRGFTFGNEIQALQQEIHDEQSKFISSIGTISFSYRNIKQIIGIMSSVKK